MSTSFFLSRRALKPAAHSGMPHWQDPLFIRLSRSANDATDYFQIPTGRVVEVGTQVTIQGREPHKFRPNLSQDGNSCIVSWAEKNILTPHASRFG